MPIISDSPKELYAHLYKELKSKHSSISVYLKDKSELTPEEREIGKAMEEFIGLYETVEKDFSMKTGYEEEINGVDYSDINFETTRKELESDEKACEKLEIVVQKIRQALFKSVEVSIGEGYDYEKEKLNASPQERFTALTASISDRTGAWQNEAIDNEVQRRMAEDLEFPHRPEIYLKVKDPKTDKYQTVKAERYVSYKEKFSKEHRFFDRKDTHIKYEREQDPDAYTVAKLALRDILENHKERKAESDRRREYVKFINKQHQAYAVWKEQMPKEREKFNNLVLSLSEETQKRFNDVMADYNSVTSIFSGIKTWLDQEKANYVARKKVLEDAKKVTDAAYEEYKKAKSPYDEYLKDMKEERDNAENALNELKKNPALTEEYRKEQEMLFDNYKRLAEELTYDVEFLDKEIQAALAEQKKTRDMLMSVSEKARQYKEQILKLKESQSKDNLDAVKNYYKLLFDGEVELTTGIEEQQKELNEAIEEQSAISKLVDDEKTLMVKSEIHLSQKKAELYENKNSLERAKLLAEQLNKSEIKELQKYIKKVKETILKTNVPEEERREELAKACEAYAQAKKWRVGTDIIYLDTAEAKDLQKRIKENEKDVEDLTKVYDEQKASYAKLSMRLSEINATLYEKIEEASKAIDQFTNKLEALQGENRDQVVNDIVEEINLVSAEKVTAEGKNLTEAEAAIEKSFNELNDVIKHKIAQKEAKVLQLKDTENKRLEVESAIQNSVQVKVHLEEQQRQFIELVEKQEQKKKQLEEALVTAETEWMSKEMEEDTLETDSKDFIADYELVQKKFDEKEVSSVRRMEDLSKLVEEQQKKLSKDAEAQKEYIHNKEEVFCRKLRGDLLNLKLRLLDVMQPQGRFKSSNSREFTEFKNTMLMYLEPRFNVPDPDNKGAMKSVDNPNYILDKLEDIFGGYHISDQDRVKNLKDICTAMGKIAEVSEKYLKEKGNPHRVTELGRARFALANDMRTFSENVDMQVKGMLREEEYCKVAPELSKIEAKSGLSTSYEKTDAYRYTGNAIKKEEDVLSLDVLLDMDEQSKKEKAEMEKLQKEIAMSNEKDGKEKVEVPVGPNP